jgi:hypothetical protein
MFVVRYKNFTTPMCRYDTVARGAASSNGGGWKWIGVELLMFSAIFVGFDGLV